MEEVKLCACWRSGTQLKRIPSSHICCPAISSVLPGPIRPSHRERGLRLCGCPPAAAHGKLGEAAGTRCVLAGSCTLMLSWPGEHRQGSESCCRGVSGLQTLPQRACLRSTQGTRPRGPASPPVPGQHGCRSKAGGAGSPVSSPASGRPPGRRHLADAVAAKPCYRFGARSRWVPLERTDRHGRRLPEGTLPTACGGHVFPRCCSEPCAERQAVGNGRQAEAAVTSRTATRL